jgi:hypothetical protein
MAQMVLKVNVGSTEHLAPEGSLLKCLGTLGFKVRFYQPAASFVQGALIMQLFADLSKEIHCMLRA